jgi:cytochrome bd-type quinol oxidase subunit 2
MIIPITVCVILLAAVVYLAVSRRSSFKIRLAALAALAAMLITVIICLFRIFMTPATDKVQVLPDHPPPPPPPPPNTMALALFIIILMVMFLIVLFLSIKEHRRVTSENNSLNKLGF